MPSDYCVFCEIVVGSAPASVVYRDDLVMASMDIRPVNPGHLLVIPLNHATYLADMGQLAGMRMFNAAHRIAQAVRDSNVRREGINLLLSDGVATGQEVLHVHLRVIPRFAGNQMVVTANWGIPPSKSELDANAVGLWGRL